jgi:hypothetical protein
MPKVQFSCRSSGGASSTGFAGAPLLFRPTVAGYRLGVAVRHAWPVGSAAQHPFLVDQVGR